jgi:hypothetical protein
VTSTCKISSNRANARLSTGPRTPAGKSRSAKSALRHGLSLPIVSDPIFSEEVETLAREIAGMDASPEMQERAHRISEAQMGFLSRAVLWPRARSRPCESAFRAAGTLEVAYSINGRDAIENIIDIDPVAALVRAIMADRAQWTGSASDLLQVGTNRSGWPKSPRALAGRLRRAQTFLRTLGIEIVFGREVRLGTRTIGITALSEHQSRNTVSTVSRVSDNNGGRGAGLRHPPPGLEQAL